MRGVATVRNISTGPLSLTGGTVLPVGEDADVNDSNPHEAALIAARKLKVIDPDAPAPPLAPDPTFVIVDITEAADGEVVVRDESSEYGWATTNEVSGGGTAAATTFAPAGSIAATNVQAALEELDAESGGGSAASTTFAPAGTIAATNVQAALVEVAGEAATALSDHLADTVDAHDASAISFTPAGTVAATDVQAAIAEVASEAARGSLETFDQQGVLAVQTGTGRLTFPVAVTILGVVAAVSVAPTGAAILVDVNKNGTTIYTTQGNRPSIAAAGFASTVATPAVTAFAAGDYMTVDIDQVGSTVPGANLVVTVRYREA